MLEDSATIAALFDLDKRRGVYVLEFADGTRYVGQAEDVVSRYRTHRHGSAHHDPWPGVVAISFRAVPTGDLDEPEQAAIRDLRRHFRLRNRTHNFGHWEPSALDEFVHPDTQRHWATGQPEYILTPFAEAAQKLRPGTPRLLAARPGQEVLPDGRRVWEAVVDELAQVVALAIPNATETEGRFWSISDYPSTARGRFATLNVGSLELAYFPRSRFVPQRGTLSASSGLVSVLNSEFETFITPEELPTEFGSEGTIASMEVIEGHAVEFIRRPASYAVPVDSVEMPLGVFGVKVLGASEVAGVRSLAIHAMRRGSARINSRSRGESLTRLVYRRAADPDFRASLGVLRGRGTD